MTLLYVIAAGRVVTLEKSMGHAGFAHFLAIVFSIVTAICYLILHFVPRKAYRLLYALTFLLIITMFLVSHSIGLVGPTVTDCGTFSHNFTKNWTMGSIGEIIADDNTTAKVGSLGQTVANCSLNELTFAAGFINIVMYIIAIFDVQNVLLSRVKSKTYGERFVEMGISN
ncbi:hypothetical protein STCU_00325 [Strigomonas culicis]|uniref:Uncharacterized protein n=1 Tax=Strigomonas culicis TaxID=28005 RepID=S9WLT2_9TRYP|nr:hypothetical protein STCU_00325 [Strigomonas culicis]|eukprot:EPY36950.1 hypothetical protein STCU_00325 [Strigomonas culicis]